MGFKSFTERYLDGTGIFRDAVISILAAIAWQERVRRETPLVRWGTPEDVARAARWLVSPAAAFITGQVIRVNGGAVRA